jgi:hypothetical protein
LGIAALKPGLARRTLDADCHRTERPFRELAGRESPDSVQRNIDLVRVVFCVFALRGILTFGTGKVKQFTDRLVGGAGFQPAISKHGRLEACPSELICQLTSDFLTRGPRISARLISRDCVKKL